MKRRKHFFSWLLILLGLILAAAGVLLLFSLPGSCSYVTAAPEFSGQNTVQSVLIRLSENVDLPWAADLRQQDVQVSSDRAAPQSAALYAVGEGFFDFFHETLEAGRLLNRGDLAENSRTVMVNRKAADILFPGMDPVGQAVRLGETSLEVVGVTAGGFRLGETQEMLLFVPITLADSRLITPRTLEVWTGSAESEMKVQFAESVRKVFPEGSLQDYPRLRLAALMPLWLIACCFGAWVLKKALGMLYRFAGKKIRRTRLDLEASYPSRIVPQIAGRAGSVLFLFALWAGAAFLLLRLAALPLYTFTDWIPESPADPASVVSTVRNLLFTGGAAAVYKTRAGSAAEICAMLIRTGSLFFLSGLVFRFCLRTPEKSPSHHEGD